MVGMVPTADTDHTNTSYDRLNLDPRSGPRFSPRIQVRQVQASPLAGLSTITDSIFGIVLLRL